MVRKEWSPPGPTLHVQGEELHCAIPRVPSFSIFATTERAGSWTVAGTVRHDHSTDSKSGSNQPRAPSIS